MASNQVQSVRAEGARSARTAAIVREFAEAAQFQTQRDTKLWRAVDLLLTELGADALIFRTGPDGEPLSVFKSYIRHSRREKDKIIARVSALADMEQFSGHAGKLFNDSQSRIEILFCLPNFGFVTESGKPSALRLRPFFAFLKMERQPGGYGYARWKSMTALNDDAPGFDTDRLEYFETYCRTVQLAFAKRAESDDIFPPRLSQAFWNAVDDEEDVAPYLRPWEGRGGLHASRVLTATLSFDIRKSTFAMENAIDGQAYADWIDGLVVLLKRVSHLYGGIFDKFTGDGALIHFAPISTSIIEFDDALSTRERISSLALTCAWDLLRSFSDYSTLLLPNLAIQKSSFGAAIGLALDYAYWSVDRNGSPIVVGRGVVHACRSSNGPAGTVQSTNGFYRSAAHLYPDGSGWQTVDFVTKEFPPGSDVELVRFLKPADRMGKSGEALWTLCRDVENDVLSRRRSGHDFGPASGQLEANV